MGCPSLKHKKETAYREHLCNHYPALSMRESFFFLRKRINSGSTSFCPDVQDKMIEHGRHRGPEGCLFVCFVLFVC